MQKLLRSVCVCVQDMGGRGGVTFGPADRGKVIFSIEEKMLLCNKKIWSRSRSLPLILTCSFKILHVGFLIVDFFWQSSCKIAPWALEVREGWSSEGKFSHLRVTEAKVKKDHLYFEERANEGRKERTNEPSMVPLCISMQIWKVKVTVIGIAFNEQYLECTENYHQRSGRCWIPHL